MSEAEYTINHAIDGWPVCKDGKAIPNNRVMLAELHQLQARIKELESLTHKQRELEAQLQGEINHLEAENAELRERMQKECRKNAERMQKGEVMNLIDPADQREILIYAFRYALGRRSVAVYTASEAIKKAWPELTQTNRELIQREIREAIESERYGMECDKQTWERILWLE